jgi:threonine aldolase
VLAAAGLVALDRIDRLAEDHARATALATGLQERGWRAATPQTNIVLIAVADLDGTLRRFEESGVRASAMSGQVRLMTHADVGDADIAAALHRIGPIEPPRGNGGPAPVRSGGRAPRPEGVIARSGTDHA